MDDPVNVVQICQPLQNGQSNVPNNVDINGSNIFVNAVQGTLVHELHAYTDIGVRYVRAVERDDVSGITIVHDLQFAQDLLSYGRFRVDQHNLQERLQVRILA